MHWEAIFLTIVKSPPFGSRRYRGQGSGHLTATILFIRHAAHAHLDIRLSGRLAGVPLSEAGTAQAAALGAALAGQGITRVDCSPLTRTCQTAQAITRACGLPAPAIVDALVEIDMGDWTGAPFGSLHGPAWDAWNNRRGSARIPGGETMAEAQARIVGHLERLADEADGQTIALVSHSDMIRAGVAHVLGLPLDNLLRFDIAPASVSRAVIGDWGAKLLSLNERMC